MASNYGRDYDRMASGMNRYSSGGTGRGYGSDYSGYRGGSSAYGMDYMESGDYGRSGGSGNAGYGGYGASTGQGGYGGSRYGGGYGGQSYGRGGYGSDYDYGGSMEGRGGYGGSQSGSLGSQYGGGYGNAGYGYGGGYGGGSDRYGSQGRQGQMRASELMTRDPETVTADATLADAAKKMRDMNVGVIPVVESTSSKRLKGLVTDRDIAIRAVAVGKDSKAKVSEVMTTDVETCNQNDSVDQVLQLMQREQVRRVPITDREGRLVGIIAQADVATEYGGDDGQRDDRVADTLEQVSEPGNPRRGGRGGMQDRNQSQGGMQAESSSSQNQQSQGSSSGRGSQGRGGADEEQQ